MFPYLCLWLYAQTVRSQKKKNLQKKLGVFGGIHSVSSAVILFVPKLRLVWILWCKIGVVLCHKCLRERTNNMRSKLNKCFVSLLDVKVFIVIFTTSSVSAETIASMDLSPNSPKTHQNLKIQNYNVNSRKKNY
jgi:hypothetical protein